MTNATRRFLARALKAILSVIAAGAVSCATQGAAPDSGVDAGVGRNVILVLVDGLRWQEVFSGADETLMNKEFGGVSDDKALRQQFWRDTRAARREALLPFFWNTFANEGQLIGNQQIGSVARVSNGLNFSYPGYSEMICGFVDPSINSNDRTPNPNVTVLEWLNGRPGFEDRVAVVGAWDVVSWIVNRDRSGLFVNAGWEPLAGRLTERSELLNELKSQLPRRWPAEPDDAITFQTALEVLKRRHPRVTWITLGETDEFAHEVRYDLYLQSAHRTDAMLRQLWETVQSIEGYRNNTTLIVTTDHGRGATPRDWPNHGEKVPSSQYVWIAILGPDTPALGERTGTFSAFEDPYILAQVAATLAAAVGEDYPAAQPLAAPPIQGAISRDSDMPDSRSWLLKRSIPPVRPR